MQVEFCSFTIFDAGSSFTIFTFPYLDVRVFREAGTRGCVPREGGHYKCKCKRGFAGRYCERGKGRLSSENLMNFRTTRLLRALKVMLKSCRLFAIFHGLFRPFSCSSSSMHPKTGRLNIKCKCHSPSHSQHSLQPCLESKTSQILFSDLALRIF